MASYMVPHPHPMPPTSGPHPASAPPNSPAVHPPWCDICRKTFPDMPQYIDHLKSHIANQIGLFNCAGCHGVCRNPDHLKAIIRSGPTPQQLPPPPNPDPARMVAVELREADPPKKLGNVRKKQKKMPHDFPRPFSCDICDKSFTKDTYLIQHRRIHTGERPFICDVCQKTFTQSGHLVNHKRVHIGDRPFNCEICQKAFAHSRNLIRHRRAHTGERPYSCDLCGKNFLQSEHLQNHKRRIHEGQKLSNPSGRRWKSKRSCQECGKTFSHAFNLERHSRIHTGERPFQCQHCDKSFNQSTHLTNHMKSHEKPLGESGSAGEPGKSSSPASVTTTTSTSSAGTQTCKLEARPRQVTSGATQHHQPPPNVHPNQPPPPPTPVMSNQVIPMHPAATSTPTMHPNNLLPRPPEVNSCVFPPGFPWYRAAAHSS